MNHTLLIVIFAINFLMCGGRKEMSGRNLDTIRTVSINGNNINQKEISVHDYSGQWIYIHNSQRNDYTINLKFDKDSIIGNHCFIGLSGNRIDCFEGVEKTIKGIIQKDGSFNGEFFSEYANKKFKLKMNIVNDTLYWSGNTNSEVFYSNNLKFIKDKEK